MGQLACALPMYAETPVQAWVQRYSNSVGGDDRAKDVTTDADGNVIAVGSSDDKTVGEDFLIIKYSGAGVPLWTNRYNGPGNSNDVANVVRSDTAGNIFVAGSSVGSNGYYDYAIIAYSSGGVPLWTNRYNGPGNSNDFVTALALDENSRVFVTGISVGSGSGYDYATIAYAGGVGLWTNRYNGTGNNEDRPYSIASSNGNVFVTGESGVESGSDYVTIAYSSSGEALWTNRYNGEGNYADRANAVAVGPDGNVVVTGWAYLVGRNASATIKYSPAGTALWTNFYAGSSGSHQAEAIAFDTNGNIFITGAAFKTNGSSGGDYDFATIAYSSAGVLLWSNHFGEGGFDYAVGIAVDGAGDVVIAGYSGSLDGLTRDFVTIKYSGGGLGLWTNRYNGPAGYGDMVTAMAMDDDGSVFVTGQSAGPTSSIFDWATIAYSPAGLAFWTNRYNGTGNRSDVANAVKVAPNGNIVVTGYSTDSSGVNGFQDYLTIMHTASGTPVWTNRYGGVSGQHDSAEALVIDADGNAFVTGRDADSAYATIKYSPSGDRLWTNRYRNIGFTSISEATAITKDPVGDVIVTGKSAGTNSPGSFPYDYATVKYSNAGVPLWTNRYTGPFTTHDDVPHAIASDVNGNVFVTGTPATVAYAGSGAALWTNLIGTSLFDRGSAVAADTNGNVFVGASLNSGGFATLKYSGAGVPLWTNHGSPANALALDKIGNVFVTGTSGNDYVTTKFSNSGAPLWTNRYNGGATDNATAIVVDSDENVFVSGYSSLSGRFDYLTIKYSNAGVPLWTNRYNGSANGNDEPRTKLCLEIAPDGAVYVAGGSDGDYSSATNYDFATVKYISLPAITSHPVSRTNNVGTTATFSVSATGSASLRHQWQRNETNLFDVGNVSGVNSNMLTLTNVQAEDAANYSVVVTNAFGSVTTSAAVLAIVAPSPITLSSAVVSNGVFSFSFTNTPGANFTVLSSTNVTLPLSNWMPLSALIEMSPGKFRFSDSQAATNRQRFYRVRSP